MNLEARYKIGKEIAGPRPLAELRREIQSGMLPANTPVQLTHDGLWTDLAGAEKKANDLRNPVLPRSPAFRFLAANALVAAVGWFWPLACLLAAGTQYLAGIVLNYFDEGRKRPAVALVSFVSMLFPIFVIVFSGARAKPQVLWLVFSGFAQLALFIVFMQLRFT